MGTELIAAWIYKNGELMKQRMEKLFFAVAAIIASLLTFTLFLISNSIAFFAAATSWKMLAFFFLLATLLYGILRILCNDIFLVYKKIVNPEDEEILFTSNKIASTKKTWILNNEVKKLVSVHFNTTKRKELLFKVIEIRPGKRPVRYTIYIPVPMGEFRNAEKVKAYFDKKLPL